MTANPPRLRFRHVHPAVLALGSITLAWVLTFSILVVNKQNGFWSIDFDMGIFDQAVWLLARGQSFITVRGLPVFGHHANFGLYLFAPASWLGSGPNFLNVTQVIVLGFGVVPIYLLGRYRMLNPWSAAALAAAFLLHPALQFFTAELFHPEAIALTPLLMAYLCAAKRSWRWFAFWAIFAVMWKEDVALAVAMLGIIIALRGKNSSEKKQVSNRTVGLITLTASLGWLIFVSQVLIPEVSGNSAHYGELYSGVGGSVGGMFSTMINDPGNITSRLTSSETQYFGWQLLAPYGLTSLLAPIELLIGLPQFILDAISNYSWTRTITFRYAAIPLVAATLAMVEGVAFACRRAAQIKNLRLVSSGVRLLPLAVLACAVVATFSWGPSPIGSSYQDGWWPLAENTRQEAQQGALDTVLDDEAVSASYSLVPQLSRRSEIYSFPNPWKSQNWGVTGSKNRNPQRIKWLVIDRYATDSQGQKLLDSLIAKGKFKKLFDQDGMWVARRIDS